MGTQLSLPKNGAEPPIFGPCLLWPNGCMYQDNTLGTEVGLSLGDIVLDGEWEPSFPSPKGAQPPTLHSASVRCGQTAGWTKIPLGMKVVLG